MIRLSKFVFILSWEVYDVEIGKVTSMSTELLRPHQGSPLQVAGQLKGSVVRVCSDTPWNIFGGSS